MAGLDIGQVLGIGLVPDRVACRLFAQHRGAPTGEEGDPVTPLGELSGPTVADGEQLGLPGCAVDRDRPVDAQERGIRIP